MNKDEKDGLRAGAQFLLWHTNGADGSINIVRPHSFHTLLLLLLKQPSKDMALTTAQATSSPLCVMLIECTSGNSSSKCEIPTSSVSFHPHTH